MRTITTTADLSAYCEAAAAHPYVAVDTEFLRERTYWAKLCLVQLAMPTEGDPADPDGAVLIDPLAEGIDLAPLWALMVEPSVVKVLHAARQDVEIMHHDGGVIPAPLFDTQVAAMVAGFGEQVGYETLVRKIARQQLDKTSRFTDWSRRPLSDAQKRYAIADVTHLRAIYEHLREELDRTGRAAWVEEEIAVLSDPATYVTEPEDAWRRLKLRSSNPRFAAVAAALADWRERAAQERDVPRGRVLKDDALLEVAGLKPKTAEELGRSRLVQREGRKPETAKGILDAVARGMAADEAPFARRDSERLQVNPALSDLLRVLLKAKAETLGVASKLIATSADLDRIAAGKRDVPALKGWRAEAFGEDAVRLCEGRLALAAEGEAVRVIALA
ncbi:ribonuclease D [Hasllibacter halocynthiae]|uniref:Ribonuclease D n=1 Tax=Hasllibacter halocynthiae TaxID=595589 RepID=A0A2T0X7P7_9RHOB|nr:ribonuclease D [Hasllibacter halocynthiae]PRY94972.1 ribonuclease D [Hasllibacter halocynthiae]